MRATELSLLLETEHRFSPGPDPDITDITNDSRKVIPGALYAALPGEHVDGHRYIAEAIDRGAAAILCARDPEAVRGSVAVLQTPNLRRALSEASHHLFGRPSQSLTVIGVTGTDGKTTTSSFIHQMLGLLGYRTGLLSSALIDIGAGERPNLQHQSTPEAPEVHRALRTMESTGVTHAVIESTSHGLSTKTCRLAHVFYDAVVLTNMSPEHLEFHGTFEQYRHDKANLFRALDYGCYAAAGPLADSDDLTGRTIASGSARGLAVLNADDPVASYFRSATGATIRTFSLRDGADYTATIKARADSSELQISTPSGQIECVLGVPGEFNVSNLLATVAVIQAVTDASPTRIARAITEIHPVNGRMMVVQRDPFPVVVDFAHTPGSFSRVLPFFRRSTAGRLILVFGSAGERDVTKRPLQGELADQYADVVFLTDEDPRGEPSEVIIEQIANGFRRLQQGRDLHAVPDRREAIERALRLAGSGDTVLLLGKGHETSIIGAEGPKPWNEFKVAQELLEQIVRA